MRKVKFFSVFVLLVLFAAMGAPRVTLAQGPDDDEQVPMCLDMPDAQIPGKEPGSACRVPIMPAINPADASAELKPLSLYRSGWTHRWTSESDSDLVEDLIKVEGYLYFKSKWEDDWLFEPPACEDPNEYSYHAACRTFGGGPINKQDGYHYFRKSGYQDDSFSTRDVWESSS